MADAAPSSGRDDRVAGGGGEQPASLATGKPWQPGKSPPVDMDIDTRLALPRNRPRPFQEVPACAFGHQRTGKCSPVAAEREHISPPDVVRASSLAQWRQRPTRDGANTSGGNIARTSGQSDTMRDTATSVCQRSNPWAKKRLQPRPCPIFPAQRTPPSAAFKVRPSSFWDRAKVGRPRKKGAPPVGPEFPECGALSRAHGKRVGSLDEARYVTPPRGKKLATLFWHPF